MTRSWSEEVRDTLHDCEGSDDVENDADELNLAFAGVALGDRFYLQVFGKFAAIGS